MPKIIEKELIIADSVSIPLQVYQEKRVSWRISLGRSGAILRLPMYFSKSETNEKIAWGIDWVSQQIDLKPNLKTLFTHKHFNTGDTIQLIGQKYTLHISQSHEIIKLSAKLKQCNIYLSLPELKASVISKSVAKLLSKIAVKICEDYITRRIDELNDRFLQMNIGRISFKYNHSNWGSCSSKSNLNISTRLLLAPVEVIDYVLVHELCHLVHLNHSDKFWNLVESIMPHYKQHEKWLKKYGKFCDFKPIQ